MSSITTNLYLDFSHRCLREMLHYLSEGRFIDALDVGCLGAELYREAAPSTSDEEVALFIHTALRTPHPSEPKQKAGRAA